MITADEVRSLAIEAVKKTMERTHAVRRKGKIYQERAHERKVGERPLSPKEIGQQIGQSTMKLKMLPLYRGLRKKGKAQRDPKLGQVIGFDKNTMHEIESTWAGLVKKFPKVGQFIKKLQVQTFKGEDAGTIAESGENKIILDKGFLNDRALLIKATKEDERTGFYHEGVSKKPWTYFLTHEFGHNIEYVISELPEYDAWAKAWRKNKRMFKNKIGNYAIWDEHEGFAEAFANRMVLGNSVLPDEMDKVIAAIERAEP